MSGDLFGAWRDVLLPALKSDARVGGVAHLVDDGAAGRSNDARLPFPNIRLIDGTAREWGAKDRAGAELTCEVVLRDKGTGTRLDGVLDAVLSVLAELPRDFAGWETSGAVVLGVRRSRAQGGDQRVVTVRVRGWRA